MLIISFAVLRNRLSARGVMSFFYCPISFTVNNKGTFV